MNLLKMLVRITRSILGLFSLLIAIGFFLTIFLNRVGDPPPDAGGIFALGFLAFVFAFVGLLLLKHSTNK